MTLEGKCNLRQEEKQNYTSGRGGAGIVPCCANCFYRRGRLHWRKKVQFDETVYYLVKIAVIRNKLC